MRVALVWPKGNNPLIVLPLSFAYLKSNLDNATHEVRIIDCALHNIDAGSAEFRTLL